MAHANRGKNVVHNETVLVGNTRSGLATTRRTFLKKGLVAGAGAALVYVAPSFTSVYAQRAYAGITAPCDCKDQLLFGDWVPEGTTLESGKTVQDLSNLSITITCTPGSYVVSGLTLLAVDASIKTNNMNPVDQNTGEKPPYAGYFQSEYDLDPQRDIVLEKTTCNCSEHTHDAVKAQVTIYQVNVTPLPLTCTLWYPWWIQHDKKNPRHPDYSKLTQSAKDEWVRFIGKLKDHEEGHRDVLRQSVEDVVRSLTGYQGTAIACTKERAIELADGDCMALYNDHFDSIDLDQNNYDVATDNGVTQGALLDKDQ